MGLGWHLTHVGRRWTGYDVEGNEYAFALRRSGEWDIYIWPIGSGEPKGVWIHGAWPTVDEATDFADLFVVAYVDSVDANETSS